MVMGQVSHLQSGPPERADGNSRGQAEAATHWQNFFFLRDSSVLLLRPFT